MSLQKRYLVLDRKNTALKPRDYGHPTTFVKNDRSPSFTTEEGAKAFADALALANPGAKFYLTEVMARVKTPESGTVWGATRSIATEVADGE